METRVPLDRESAHEPLSANDSSETEITRLLGAWSEDGDKEALEELIRRLYEELRHLAKRHFAKERRGHTLQPTVVIHELFLRLSEGKRMQIQDRTHFLAVASRIMRNFLVDYARARKADRRGGGAVHVTLQADLAGKSWNQNLLDLHHAMEDLREFAPTGSQIVEMRFFGGLKSREIADALGLSERQVRHQWEAAKLWLLRKLRQG